MPTYEYKCDACGGRFEVVQRITEDPLTECRSCKGAVRRVIGPAAFVLKGGGWYSTDYPSESRKKAAESEKPAGAADKKTDAASSESPKPSEPAKA